MPRLKEKVIAHLPIELPRWIIAALPVAGLVAVMTGAAYFRLHLPFTPVPVTFQTLVVLLGCALLDPRRAAMGQGLYLGLGTLGVPVVAGGAAGLALLLGPTGGYLVGFVAAGVVVSRLLGGRRASLARVVLVMALGETIILSFGAAHLVAIGFSVEQALTLGVAPFLLWDAIKVSLAATTYRLMVGSAN